MKLSYHCRTLRQGQSEFILENDFMLDSGAVLNPLTLIYETWGGLSAKKDNAVLIHHALSTHAHVASNSINGEPGWWEQMLGPGRYIDTNRFFVICVNNLGSCHGSLGPASVNPQTHVPYRMQFPTITIRDIARSQHLLVKALGIERLYAIVGNSMGAMMSLQWAIDYPDTVLRLITTASCYKAYPHNIAVHSIQRDIIQLDPAWQGGNYENNSLDGFKLARKIGLLTYRNREELDLRFHHKKKESTGNQQDDDFHEIEKYLEYNAIKFIKQFDPSSYIYLTEAMDTFDVTIGFANTPMAFARIKAKICVISIDSDLLFPPQQQEDMITLFLQANHQPVIVRHRSSFGHDAFLVELNEFGGYIESFLEAGPSE